MLFRFTRAPKITDGLLKEWICSGNFNHANRALAEINLAEYPDVLHFAAGIGAVEAVRYLVENGAPINARHKGIADSLKAPEEGPTPLFMAATARRHTVLEYLLCQRANPNLSCTYFPGGTRHSGLMPLHQAVRINDARMVNSLLRYRADISPQTSARETPLLIACQLGFWPIAEVLLTHGAIPDAPTAAPGGLTAIEMIDANPRLKKEFCDWRSKNEPNIAADAPRLLMA